MPPAEIQHMKWWGWGGESIEFDISDKPDLWPYITKVLGIKGEPTFTPPKNLEEIDIPEQNLNSHFVKTVQSGLREDQIKMDKRERLIHAYGKSFRDLWRIRNGIVEAVPDCVIYPESEEDVCLMIKAASEHDVILIPFGGGSNIAGCLEV
ncbi:FAD-binding protein, partial [bacterium]|nr:FAD-binding protein [bacterium]